MGYTFGKLKTPIDRAAAAHEYIALRYPDGERVFITQINPKDNWKILFRSVQGSREIENQLKSSLKGCQS
jgi:hypothetical protein